MSLREKIDIEKLPVHIAIIMDGNGRWATQHGKDRIFGHQQGVESVRNVIEAAAESESNILPSMPFQRKTGEGPMMRYLH